MQGEKEMSISPQEMTKQADEYAEREVARLPAQPSRELIKALVRVAYIAGGMDFLNELKRELQRGR